MTNLERKYQLTEEFMKWFFQSKEKRNPEPSWCKDQHCEDSDGRCWLCFTKWLDKEVKMTKFEKWKNRIAEAKDERDFLYQLHLMGHEMYDSLCRQTRVCDFDCVECRARWLEKEVEKE